MDVANFYHMLKQVKRGKNKAKAKAGWFRDPRDEAQYRFWNGDVWTDETSETLPLPGREKLL